MNQDVLKKLWESFVAWLKKWLLEFIIKNTMKKSVAALGGVKGWLILKVYEIGWKRVILPFLGSLKRGALSVSDKLKNKKKVEDVHDAETKADFDDAMDDLS